MNKKSWYELTPDDFPLGEPVLKMKRGLWYRPHNSGYTDTVLYAGLYPRESALSYCFSEGKNGKYDVIAVPVRRAMEHDNISRTRINELRDRLNELEKYVEADNYETVIF